MVYSLIDMIRTLSLLILMTQQRLVLFWQCVVSGRRYVSTFGFFHKLGCDQRSVMWSKDAFVYMALSVLVFETIAPG